jgi:hypothetical protein
MLAGAKRRWLLWLLPFPVLYWALIVSVSVAVPRNLYPLIPPVSLFLGVGAAELVRRVRLWDLRAMGRWAAPAFALLLLTWPIAATSLQAVGFTRPGTRVQAREWVRENVPRGAIVLKEEYTPHFSEEEYAIRLPGGRFIGGMPSDQVVRPEIDLVILSSGAFGRYFEPQRAVGPDYFEIRERYRGIREEFPLLARFQPSRARLGPTVELYRPLREPTPYLSEMRFPVTYAFVPRKSMLLAEEGRIAFDRDGDWCQFKGFFRAGRYRLRAPGWAGNSVTAGEGRIDLRNLENELLAVLEPDASGALELSLPEDGKYFFYLFPPSGNRISGLEIRRFETASPGV